MLWAKHLSPITPENAAFPIPDRIHLRDAEKQERGCSASPFRFKPYKVYFLGG